MRGIRWIILLSSVFALTLGVSASTASFGKITLGCIDYCTAEEYAKINATQQYWFYMVYGWILLAFTGLAGIILVSFRRRSLRVIPVAVGLIGTTVSGLIVFHNTLYSNSGSLLSLSERAGLPFSYWATDCIQAPLSYCPGGEYHSFSLFYLLLDLIAFSLLGVVVSIWVGRFQTRSRFETLTSKYGGVNDQLEPG